MQIMQFAEDETPPTSPEELAGQVIDLTSLLSHAEFSTVIEKLQEEWARRVSRDIEALQASGADFRNLNKLATQLGLDPEETDRIVLWSLIAAIRIAGHFPYQRTRSHQRVLNDIYAPVKTRQSWP